MNAPPCLWPAHRLPHPAKAVLAAALGGVALSIGGALLTGQVRHFYLLWNLTLALVPLGLAIALRTVADRHHWVAVLLGTGWILFLPNSPYILTDFIHLTHTPRDLRWGHFLLIAWCSVTGLLAGLLSLWLVHGLAERRFGGRIGWSLVGVASLASGFGVFLGRFRRWNSWDVVTEPFGLGADIARQLFRTTPSVTDAIFPFVFGGMLFCSYLVLWTWMPESRESTAQKAHEPRTS